MEEGIMIEIRRGRRKDAPNIIDFQIRMAKETEDFALDRPTVEKGVHAVFDDPHKGAYWIAELDGKVVGCLLTVPEWSDWRNGTVLWIHSLYVIPSARRRGIFRNHIHVARHRITALRIDSAPRRPDGSGVCAGHRGGVRVQQSGGRHNRVCAGAEKQVS